MTQYTDYIGSGTANVNTSGDYDTFALWIAASGTATPTYSTGDELRVVFQSSADGHNGNHPFGGNLRNIDDDVNLTVTLSSTNLTGSGPLNGALIMGGTSIGGNNDAFQFQAKGEDKTISFNNLDIIVNDYRNMAFNVSISSDAENPSKNLTVNMDNCRVGSPSDSGENGMLSCGSNNINNTGEQTFNFTNTIFTPRRRLLRQFPGGNSFESHVTVNARACSFFYGTNSFLCPNRDPDSSFRIHASGCIVHSFASINNFNGFVTAQQPGYTSGAAIDYITNEPDAVVDNWTTDKGGIKTNVSAPATFVYGIEPANGEIGFSGPTIGNSPYDLAGGTMDLRLWNSTNNAASGFVSNVTLPSPDLAGHDRGSTPFDAGPYEISFTTGGGGSSDTRPTFKIVQVNMYN